MRTIDAYKQFKKPPPIIRPTQIIFHSACDNYSVEGHLDWQYNGDLESHVIFSRVGDLYRITPYNRRAQANYSANGPRSDGSGALSGETSSDINAEDPWSDAQLVSMAQWAKDRMAEFPDIARRVCRSPNDPGIGFHTMWGAPSAWTPVAKTCPGPERKKQFYSTLIPMIFDTNRDNDDMPITDAEMNKIAEKVWSQIIKEAGNVPVWALLQEAAKPEPAPTVKEIAEQVWSQIIKEADGLPVWSLLVRAAENNAPKS